LEEATVLIGCSVNDRPQLRGSPHRLDLPVLRKESLKIVLRRTACDGGSRLDQSDHKTQQCCFHRSQRYLLLAECQPWSRHFGDDWRNRHSTHWPGSAKL